MKKFLIAHGLPGSGKTTLFKRLVSEKLQKKEEAEYLNLDSTYDCSIKKLEERLREAVFTANYERSYDDSIWFSYKPEKATVYVDCLCLTNNDLANLIYTLVNRYHCMLHDSSYKFTIIDFDDNRELCIKNDMIRSFANPTRSAKSTIETCIFEPVDVEKIKAVASAKIANSLDIECDILVESKHREIWNVYEADSAERTRAYVYSAANQVGFCVKDHFLYGEPWITGGTEWSYDGHERSVGGDKPCEFDEFDKLLTILYPAIPFLTYKGIRADCCEIEDYKVNDYYASYNKSHWSCDLDKLTDALVKFELF